MITEFVVTAGETRKRLDRFLVHRERDVSRSGLQRLIQLGRIRVNAQVVKPSQKIKPGDCITMDTPQPGPMQVNGERIPLEILYEDEALMVVNKPAGVVVHPASGNWSGTLVNAILSHWHQTETNHNMQAGTGGFGMVHRLDKDTSGVMVVAKTEQTHRALGVQFERHTITRTYEALIWGVPAQDHGMIDLAIGRDAMDRKKVSTHTAKPQPAITDYRILQRWGNVASHVSLHPRTGRTHQLRVHVASLSCPILGDQIYGGGKVCRVGGIEVPRMLLHACRLEFQHPVSNKPKKFSLVFPADMQTVREKLQTLTIERLSSERMQPC